jgi:L-amino acid N-acyltransferase YncA
MKKQRFFMAVVLLAVTMSVFSQEAVSLAKFKERYAEIERDGFESSSGTYKANWCTYAASTVSLAEFKERYAEIEKDGFEKSSGTYKANWYTYAASNN